MPAFVRALLRVPLFIKILAANAVIVAAASRIGTLPGVLISLAVNGVILHIALRPLRSLEDAVERVRGGEIGARAPLSLVADANLERLTVTYNETLDALAATQDQLRGMAHGALSAQESERGRIARELHDDTAQALAALRLRLEAARRQTDPGRRDALLEEVRDGLGEADENVRRFARGLRPPALDELGLAAALQAHAATVSGQGGPTVALSSDGVGRLDPDIELALYRIAQEAISNAIRHAGAQRVRVHVGARDGRVELSITDDGCGFTPSAAGDQGLGLFGMKERATLAGGTLAIGGGPGEGTTVSVTVPARVPAHA